MKQSLRLILILSIIIVVIVIAAFWIYKGPNITGSLGLGASLKEAPQHTNPEALVVLPELILPKTVVISIAAVFNVTTPIFMINSTRWDGNNFIIEVYSLEESGGQSNYTIKNAQVTLQNLSLGKYNVDVRDVFTGKSLSNRSFSVYPFGIIFNDYGITGKLETYKGGLSDNTFYLVNSPLNPICSPELFNYTNTWMNSTDDLVLGMNLSNHGDPKSNISLLIFDGNNNINVTPESSSFDFFDRDSSKLCLFNIKTKDLTRGIYNLTYILRFKEYGANLELEGRIPIGIYELHTAAENNEKIVATFESPFGDKITQTAENWTKYSINNRGYIWLPANTSYSATYSNFTLQEPKSPWIHVAVGAAIGAVAGAAIEVAHQHHQCEMQGGKDCAIDWVELGYKTLEGGAAGGSIALLGTVALPALVAPTLFGAGEGVALEVADQYSENGEVNDLGEICFAGIQGAIDSVAWNGAAKIAGSYVAVQRGIKEGLYQTGNWISIHEGGTNPSIIKKIAKAPEYLARAHELTRAKDVLDAVDTAHKAAGIFERIYQISNKFTDPWRSYTIETGGNLIGFDSPIIPIKSTETTESNVTSASQTIQKIELDKPVEMVLVLDNSGSMDDQVGYGTSKFEMSKNTAKNLVDFLRVYNPVDIGIVYFAESAYVESSFTSDVSGLKSRIDLTAQPNGGTSFGSGLQEALSLFEGPQLNSKKVVIFMSDGLHNTAPDPEPYIEECKKKGIVIHTIGFGSDVDENRLRSMASETGGTYSFSSDILNFENDMVDAFDVGAGWEKKERFNGTISEGELRNIGNINVPYFTDAAKVSLNWPGSDLDLVLVSPNGEVMNNTSSDIIYSEQNSKPKYIIIKKPVPGQWAIKVYGKDVPEGSTNYTVSVNELANQSISSSLILTGMTISRSILLSSSVTLFLIIAIYAGIRYKRLKKN